MFGFYSKHIVGTVLRTAFKVTRIKLFGNIVNIIDFFNYRKRRYIDGGICRFSYNKYNGSSEDRRYIILLGFIIKFIVFDMIIQSRING